MADNSTVDEFVIKVSLETDKLRQDFTKLSTELKKSSDEIKTKFDKTFDSDKLKKDLSKNTDIIKTATLNISKILTGGLGTLGGILGAKFAVDFVKNMTTNAHGIQFASQAFNTSPRNLQLLQQVYQRAGGSAQDATSDIGQLYARLNSGQNDPALFSALKALNIKVNGGKRDPVSIIFEVLSKLSTGHYTARQRQNLLSRFGLHMEAQAITNTPGSLQKYIKETQDNLLSNKSLAQQTEIDRKFQDLGERWTKIQSTLLTAILPGIESFTKAAEMLLNPTNSYKNIASHSGITRGPGFISNLKSTLSPTNIKNGLINLFSGSSYASHWNLGDSNMASSNKTDWDRIKYGIAYAETAGGDPRQIAKAEANGAYGTYGLRLSTAKDQLRFEGKYAEANSLTASMLKNNPQLSAHLSRDYYLRFQRAYGTMEAIKRYHGSTNPLENQMYYNKVMRGINYQMVHSSPVGASTVNHNQQVSYNLDNIHLHGVNNPQQFFNQMDVLRNTAFTSGRNRLA